MKKIIFAMLSICAMLCSFSCTDDNGGTGSEADLIGTWVPVELADICKHNGDIIDEDHDVSSLLVMEFNTDGSFCGYDYESGELYREGTYTYEKDVLTLMWEEEGSTYSDPMPLKSLTSDKMVIEEVEKETDDQGNIDEYIYKAVWKKKK